MPVIPALRNLRQEHSEFEASWGHIARLCLNKGVVVEREAR
jgi:hypothetical protein